MPRGLPCLRAKWSLGLDFNLAARQMRQLFAGHGKPYQTETLAQTPPDWEPNDFDRCWRTPFTKPKRKPPPTGSIKTQAPGQRIRAQQLKHAPNTHADRRGTSPASPAANGVARGPDP